MRYVHEYRDKSGKVRRYFRRYGKRVALPGVPGSKMFMRAYHEALAESERVRPAAPVDKIKQFSMAYVIRSYMLSGAYQDLRPLTKRTYDGVLRAMEEKIGHLDCRTLNRMAVQAYVEALSPGAGKNWLVLFRLLSRHMLDKGWRDTDPTLRIRRPKQGDGFPAWTMDDAARFLRVHPAGSRERLAFMLLAMTGQRRGDIVTMGRQHVRNGRLTITQSKTGNRVSLPVLPMLQAEIDRLPLNQMTFLVTAKGLPFTAAGFGNWFRDACNAAGISKSAHGLRKFLGTMLAETGSSHKEVMAILGHATEQESTRYIKSASIETLSDQAMARLLRTEQIQKLANL